MTESATDESSTDRDGVPTLDVAGREFSPTQLLSIASGAGLVGTYALSWVDIVGPVTSQEEAPDGAQVDGTTIEGAMTEGGAITASEIAVYPEFVAALGLVAIVLSVLFWHRWVHLAVVLFGLTGTGVALFMREVLSNDDALIEVAEYVGFGSSFEPALGIWATLGFSILLLGAGFGAFLNTFDMPDEN